MNRFSHTLFALSTAALVACGGGGDSGSSTAPASPASPPAPPPPVVPSIAASRISLARSPQQTCGFSSPCFQGLQFHFGSDGNVAAFWGELFNFDRVVGAHIAPGSNNATIASIIEGSSPFSMSLETRPLGGNRYAVFQVSYYDMAFSFRPPPLRGAVVSMASGTPVLTSPPVVLGGTDMPEIIQAGNGALFMPYIGDGSSGAAATIELGDGVQITRVVTARPALAELYSSSGWLGTAAAAPTAAKAMIGRETLDADLHVYVFEASLDTGALSAPLRVSSLPVQQSDADHRCGRVNVEAARTGPHIISWTAPNAALTGCDLYVQDHKLNTKPLYWAGSKPYVAAADGDGIIAVWTESEYHGPGSVFWSRRDKLGQWTPPSRLEPGIEAAWEERQELSTSSPGGSFVVEWSARTSLLPASPSWFLSKYVAGRWTTVALPWALSQLSINDAGEAVGASYEAACDAAPWCYDLIAYRFRF